VNVTFKFVGMLVILLIGVVIGLETAERGLYRVYGPPQEAPQEFAKAVIDADRL